MGAQQSANSTIPPATQEPAHLANMNSTQPRTASHQPSTSPERVSGAGDAPASQPESSSNQVQKKPLKPCCACPETKKIRDACIMEEGEENCQHLIEAHKACMRSLGFNI